MSVVVKFNNNKKYYTCKQEKIINSINRHQENFTRNEIRAVSCGYGCHNFSPIMKGGEVAEKDSGSKAQSQVLGSSIYRRECPS